MEGITLDDKVRLTFSYLEVECNLRTQHNDVSYFFLSLSFSLSAPATSIVAGGFVWAQLLILVNNSERLVRLKSNFVIFCLDE